MKKQNLLNPDDLDKLRVAVNLLESPTLTAQMANAIANLGSKIIPPSASESLQDKVVGISNKALYTVFWAANKTMESKEQPSSPILHKVAAAAVGGIGGFFGIAAVLIELPISTTIMMRSILDIAREEGFSIDDPKTRAECITVFGLEGNISKDDDNAESGYFMARITLDKLVQQANKAVAAAIAGENEKNAIVKLIQEVANRLGINLSEKAVAKSIPVIGAVLGATLNTMFTDFYQDMARGHFAVKRLEKKYSEDIIKDAYLEIYEEMKNPRLNKK